MKWKFNTQTINQFSNLTNPMVKKPKKRKATPLVYTGTPFLSTPRSLYADRIRAHVWIVPLRPDLSYDWSVDFNTPRPFRRPNFPRPGPPGPNPSNPRAFGIVLRWHACRGGSGPEGNNARCMTRVKCQAIGFTVMVCLIRRYKFVSRLPTAANVSHRLRSRSRSRARFAFYCIVLA